MKDLGRGARGMIAVMLFALLAVACGGDSDQSSAEDASPAPAEETTPAMTAEDFVAEADAICTEAARSIASAEARYTRKTSAKQSISIDADIASLVRDRYEALSELTAPQGLSSAYGAYLSKRKAATEALEQSIQARRSKDVKKATRLQVKQGNLLDEVNVLGRSIGLYACANRLPAADAKEVKKNLERYFKNPDRDTCKALSTDHLLRSIGGLSKCVDRLTASKKVRVDELDGVAGVRASAEVRADAYRDTIVLVGLVYEDGTYRINRYEPKES